MPLSGITTVVLRIYSLIWMVSGVIQLISTYETISRYSGTMNSSLSAYLIPLAYLLASAVVFLFSEPIARIVTPPPNPAVNLGGLTREDLYCFAFVFLGLYFLLSSFGESFNWLHYFIVTAKMKDPGFPLNNKPSFYQLTRSLLTLAAGATSLLTAPHLARKLCGPSKLHDAAHPEQPK